MMDTFTFSKSGLIPYTVYNISVKACTAAVSGPAGRAQSQRTAQYSKCC